MATRHMPRDPMQDLDALGPGTLARIAERLERRAAEPAFARLRDDLLAALDLPRPAAVLDLGCGTGVVARALAAGRPDVRVTAVDSSVGLLAAGRDRAEAEGLAARIAFAAGDAHALDLPAGRFDAVVAHTLLSHVRAPGTVLAEAARVTRPGGTVAVFDGDYASLAFGHPDARLGAAMEDALRAVIAAPRVVRDLPHLLRAAGLTRTATRAHAYVETGQDRMLLGLAETWGPLVAAAGLQPPAAVDAWLDGLRRAAEDGTAYAACTYVGVLARC